MQRFTKGLIAGGVLGTIGLGYALSDRRTRKKMVKDGKKAMNKAGRMVDRMDLF